MESDTKNVEYSSDEVGRIFIDSFAHVLKNLPDSNPQTERAEVLKYVLELVGPYNLYARLTPETFPALMGEIYGSTTIRDFISTVQSVFIGRWLQGRGKALLYTLVEDLAMSMSYDLDLGLAGDLTNSVQVASYCAIPAQVRDSLVTTNDLIWLYQANPLLITLTLIQQYINLDSFVPKDLDKS